MVDDNFFLYKIYALFHDPPHKMTVNLRQTGHEFFRDLVKEQKLCECLTVKIYSELGLNNRDRIYNICEADKNEELNNSKHKEENSRHKKVKNRYIKAHEIEALLFLSYLVWDTNFFNSMKHTVGSLALPMLKNNEAKKAKQIVHSADIYASEFNRWVLNYLYLSHVSGGMVKYFNFHNIFNPEKFSESNYDINKNNLEKFSNKFKSIINTNNISSIGDLYFLIYTIYEPLWIYYNLPVEVEDSRAPYFTIFDHLYASAAMVNWTYFNGKPKKTKPVKPSGFYVVIDIPGVQGIINSARKASDYWAGSWMLSMIIWLTAWQLIKEYGPDVLLAPTARFNPLYYAMVMNYLQTKGVIDDSTRKEIDEILNSVLGDLSGIYDYKNFLREPIIPATISLILAKEERSCEIKTKILKYYRDAYNCIAKEIPRGKIESGLCKEFITAFGIEKLNSGKNEEPFVRALVKKAERYTDMLLIRPAIYIIDIDEVKSEIEKDINNHEDLHKIQPSIYKQPSKYKWNHKMGNDPCELSPYFSSYYLFHYISTKLYREKIKEIYKREVLPKPEWFNNFERKFDYKNGGKDWEYCTVCGNEPAIFNFRKKEREDDYSKETKCELKNLVNYDSNRLEENDEGLSRLKVWFKPGEKLGPLCILKRGLYYSLHYAGLKVFMSTDDIAYSYYKEAINPEVENIEGCEKFEEFLNSEETNVYATFGNPITARKVINKCSSITEKSLSCLTKEYGIDRATKSFVNTIKGYRDSYAIIKADADDMTELARAEINAVKYIKITNNIKTNNIEKSYDYACSLAEIINNGYILMSPTYRVALSTAMMITLLRDIKTVEVDNYGQIIYAGGDDVVALVPIDRLIDTLIGLEKNFVSEDGFFKVRNWYIPSMSPHGRSFSVRISNIADFMTNEIQTATELLNEVKTVEWCSNGDYKKKFSVIISSSRSNYVSILPMGDFKNLELLKKMWLLNLSGILSSSVFEDYEMGLKKLVDPLSDKENAQLINRLINYVLIRNNGKDLKRDFKINIMHVTARDYKKSNIFDEIFKTFRLMRGIL